MRPWTCSVLILAACGHGAHSSKTVGNGPGGAPPDAQPAVSEGDDEDVGEEPFDEAEVPPALPAYCWPATEQAVLTPPAEVARVGFRDGSSMTTGAFWFCDTADRVVIVDPTRTGKKQTWSGEVVAIPRATGKLARSKITAKGTACVDDCGDGGSAGCSERATCTVRSKAAGAKVVTTGVPSSEAIGVVETVGDTAENGASCAPGGEQADAIVACATMNHSLYVVLDGCEVDESDNATAWNLIGLLYGAGEVRNQDPINILSGGKPTIDGTTWTYGFDDGNTTLTLQLGATPSATLTTGGQTEDCLAYALGAPS